MKNSLVVLSVVVVLALTAGFCFAGSSVRMHVNVPFSFYAGEQQLTAGEYIVEMGSSQLPTPAIITLRAQDGTGAFVLMTQQEASGNASLNQLKFNQYGDKHFLSGVSIQGFNAGVKMLRIERDARSQFEKRQSSITVAQK